MIPKSRHFPSFSNFLLLLPVLLLGIQASTSSRPKISYADNCGAIVPQHPTTGHIATSFESFQISSSRYTGGGKLFAVDPGYGSSSSHDSNTQFRFQARYIHKTQSSDVLQIGGRLSFQGPQYTVKQPGSRYSVVHTSKHVWCELSGYWSESTGQICMVGTGSMTSYKGIPLHLSVVFKLKYPKVSSIFTSLISATVESLDLVDSPSFFEKISVLAYAQNNYSYMEFPPSIKDSCTNLLVPKETRGYESSSLAHYVPNLLNAPLKLEDVNGCSEGNCYPFTLTDGSPPRFLGLSQVSFSAEGKLHALIGFSNSTPPWFGYPLELGNTFVGEGFWDYEKNQMCLAVCHILANASVGDCTIGLSLWFPLVFSMKSRSTIMGVLWSKNTMNDDSKYFNLKSFEDVSNMKLSPNMKYKYSLLEYAGFCDAINNKTAVGYRTYPGGSSSSKQDLSFSMILTRGETETIASGYASPLSFGETIIVDSFVDETSEIVNVTQWNVSYEISYWFSDRSSSSRSKRTQISAEGYYNSRNGLLCMVGCMYTTFYVLDKQESVEDTTDCSVLVNIQFPPLDPKEGERLNGSIRSRRDKLDPLYFEPLLLSAHIMYDAEATKSIWRMDIELIMVIVSLTLSCIFVRSQILYSKKRRDVLADISITMLVVVTLGYLIALILNYEALLVMIKNRQNPFSWSAEWIVVKEVVVRVLTLVAFVLHLCFLQLAWTARSASERKDDLWVAEKKTLKLCLFLYFVGTAIASFVHAMGLSSQRWKWKNLLSYAGCILDAFLLPQVLMNLFQRSQGKALCLSFYVGTTVVRIFPYFYDFYRAHSAPLPYFEFSNIYASSLLDFYSSFWDIIIPFAGILLAISVFMQQRLGGNCILPSRLRKQDGYVSVAELSL